MAASKRANSAIALASEPEPPFLINLDAARAQRSEVSASRFTVQLGHELFSFPAVQSWPVELASKLRDGDLAGAVDLLLEDEQRELFWRQRPTLTDVEELFEALGKASGVADTLGNSSASTRRSKSTAKR